VFSSSCYSNEAKKKKGQKREEAKNEAGLTTGTWWRSVLLQDFSVGGLWIPEIHHLVEKLINDDEVVLQTLLLQLLEVRRENLSSRRVQHPKGALTLGHLMEDGGDMVWRLCGGT
jgi:hypothetical protein